MIDYHFFWHGPFSNWNHSSFSYQGNNYHCGEQYMMAQKALLFSDKQSFDVIMKLSDPKDIKRVGRGISNFNQELWDNFKYQIVFFGCLEKVKQNQDVLDALIKTENKTLVEASPYDRIWGIGYSAETALNNIDNWGENLLGKIWTEIKVILYLGK